MRLAQHVVPLSLFMLAACAGQDQISGTDAGKPVSNVLAAPEAANANNSAEHQYQVTIENMTTGQVFSPGVIATHTATSSVWEVGSPASEGIRAIAEEGNAIPALNDLSSTPGVYQVISTGAPINRIGGPGFLGATSRTYTINTAANAVSRTPTGRESFIEAVFSKEGGAANGIGAQRLRSIFATCTGGTRRDAT